MLLAVAGGERAVIWTENFASGQLDPSRWQPTADGDFRESDVSVVAGADGDSTFRLGVSADTQGTRDDTVKFVGVRAVSPIPLEGKIRISVVLDWNKQSNGSYLTAAVVLCPYGTPGNPFTRSDWVKVEYVGVPPGTNARMVVGLKKGGHERTVYDEGWPETNRTGRAIGLQHLVIGFDDRYMQVWENDRLVYESKEKVADFNGAFLYLQMSSHSNYPRRTVYFSDIRVEEERDK